jgi:triacylglycerol lipase
LPVPKVFCTWTCVWLDYICRLGTPLLALYGYPVCSIGPEDKGWMDRMVHRPSFPLHDSVKDRLDPEYVAYYNKYLSNQKPAHLLPLTLSRLGNNNVPNPTGEPLPVGNQQDISIPRQVSSGPEVRVRCFVPDGEPPSFGWPLVLYIHGGGWVFRDISTENTFCTHMCVRARAVVITTDYR